MAVDRKSVFPDHRTMTVTKPEDLKGLSLLGGKKAAPSRRLEVFPNHHRGRRYTVELRTAEFTCLCPATGQPDFAELTIRYVPDRWILESKSLKLYLWSFRDQGAFHEHVVNMILDDLVKALDPQRIEVVGNFHVRGGIAITVQAAHEKKAAAPRRPGGRRR